MRHQEKSVYHSRWRHFHFMFLQILIYLISILSARQSGMARSLLSFSLTERPRRPESKCSSFPMNKKVGEPPPRRTEIIGMRVTLHLSTTALLKKIVCFKFVNQFIIGNVITAIYLKIFFSPTPTFYPPLRPSSPPASSCTDPNGWEGPWNWPRWGGLHGSLKKRKSWHFRDLPLWEGQRNINKFPVLSSSPAVRLGSDANTFNVAADQPPLCREFLPLCDLSSTCKSSSLSKNSNKLQWTSFSKLQTHLIVNTFCSKKGRLFFFF